MVSLYGLEGLGFRVRQRFYVEIASRDPTDLEHTFPVGFSVWGLGPRCLNPQNLQPQTLRPNISTLNQKMTCRSSVQRKAIRRNSPQ